MKNNNVVWLDSVDNMVSASFTNEKTVVILTHYNFSYNVETSDTDEEILYKAVSDYKNEYNEVPERVIIIDDTPMQLCIKESNKESVQKYMFNRIREDKFIALNTNPIK